MTAIIYGIKNCDTMKKAQKWLKDEHIDFTLHDYRKQGIDEALITQFIPIFGWQALINKRGTTYRALTQEQKDTLNEQNAIQIMLAHPAIIKRPILQLNGEYLIGFSTEQYGAFYAKEN